jgi:peptidoglycan hydrolase-like protein with peptidoglycan-binding domain
MARTRSIARAWRATTRHQPPGRNKVPVIVVAAVIAVAAAGWLAARQIRSPAQIASDAAPPTASQITVPVERRTLSAKVIVRGTVRFGGRQTVELGTSAVEQTSSDIVTEPARLHANLDAGDVALSVDGRPVFVLPGVVAMHRDLHRGSRGPDVRQLEQALADLRQSPGPVDGVFDAATQGAVARFYVARTFEPAGATDAQVDQLRTAQADAATALDQLHTAELGIPAAETRLATATTLAAAAKRGPALARSNNRRDQAAADADVAGKREAVALAVDEERLAILRRNEVPLDAPPSEREAATLALGAARRAVVRARAELAASRAAARDVRASLPAAVEQARAEAVNLARDARLAAAELGRAHRAVSVAQRLVTLQNDAVNTLAAESEIRVPADEVVFLPQLPVRVDEVKAKRGDTISGPVMAVTSSQVVIDSSLSVSDAKLVRVGDPVTIDEQELGIRARGRVAVLDTTPGTRKVDPNRFFLRVVPTGRVKALVGASVRLTISIESTEGAVLAVPVSALSVGGDGSSRVEVRRGRGTSLVDVVPGLAAEGFVEIRPARGERLTKGDLVVVGAAGGARGAGAGP